jgi:hypothetical protein
MPSTSTASPLFKGETARSATHFALKGKAELFLEVVVPAHSALVGGVGIDHDFLVVRRSRARSNLGLPTGSKKAKPEVAAKSERKRAA